MKKIDFDATNQTTSQFIDVLPLLKKSEGKSISMQQIRQHPKLTLTEPQGKLKI